MRVSWRTWTLRRQLVIGVACIVVATGLAVGGLMVLTVRDMMTKMVDRQLSTSLSGFNYSVDRYQNPYDAEKRQYVRSDMKPLTEFTGQAPGNIIALIKNGKVADSARFTDSGAIKLPAEARLDIETRLWRTGNPQAIELGGLGWYRVQARECNESEVLLAAISLNGTRCATELETLIAAAVTAMAVLVGSASTVALVRLALRPLNRVAGTAAEVAAIPFGRDNYRITVRADDIDPCTEVGRVGETLNRLLDHVDGALAERAASDRRMRQFITDASHELRTPLASIQGYAELTRQESGRLPDTTEYALARIEAESHRMGTLVRDLLLLARLDEGQDLQSEDVDLAGVVINAVHDAEVSGPQHHWHATVPAEAVWVRGDGARLHQLIAGLLSNALSHTPPGTAVTTSIVLRGKMILLTVSDDGPGIDPELVPHLFERFVRADKARSRNEGHAGLGLAIAESITEAHRGRIRVESETGRTVFSVELPTLQ
ncbi:histidine kinase [Mycobacteroides immunogenum]|uniref:histidine kinase n=1 Tax=Mycobacteroides immunogenum TaxID=83262 RepID=A0A179V7G8_9MYCO|nr:HAMP domain-containing sensor histidine kinase [Mycobacteroides immunogenum]OAT67868.1 histidine kinase [Mycobacteroides immunogenum]